MKQSITLFLFLASTFFGQDIILNFAGAGASSTVETVEVLNQTNGTEISVPSERSLNLTTGTVGIEKLIDNKNNFIQTYPNPFDNFINIQFYINETENVKVSISDITGKTVSVFEKELIVGTHSLKFFSQKKGLYLLSIKGNSINYSSKILSSSSNSSSNELVYSGLISKQILVSSNNNKNYSKDFYFTAGDTLKLKGISGDYSTIMVVIPTTSQTYTFEFSECTDYDNNNYSTVVIGEQVWMAENLKTTHYPNGDAIPNITDNTAWGELENNNIDDAYCYYDNLASNGNIYGELYTYAAAIGDDWTRDNIDGQGLCPDGWHLPSDVEWTTLTDYLGGESVAGGKMKEIGTIHWNSPNTGANNISGFSALPSGVRYSQFINVGNDCNWWSATEYSGTEALIRTLDFNYEGIYRFSDYKSVGYSVRCIRD